MQALHANTQILITREHTEAYASEVIVDFRAAAEV